MMVLPVRVVVVCFFGSWISAGQILEQLGNGTGRFSVWFPGVALWQLRSSVVKFRWVATFDLQQLSLKFLEYIVL